MENDESLRSSAFRWRRAEHAAEVFTNRYIRPVVRGMLGLTQGGQPFGAFRELRPMRDSPDTLTACREDWVDHPNYRYTQRTGEEGV